MKQVRIHGPGEVRIDEVPTPEPGPRDALVRVAACGICGSDLGYVKLGGVAGWSGQPMPIGHELSGVIESVGEQVEGLEPGTRVTVNPLGADNNIGNGGAEGAFAPLLLVRNAAAGGCISKLPDGLPLDMAALAEPLSVGMAAIDRCRMQPGQKAVIFGAGPIGLSALATLRHRGFEDVIAVDLSATRLAIAKEMGAAATLNPAAGDDVWSAIRDLHGTSPVLGAPMAGSDAYIEASGAAPVIEQVLGNAKAEATLSIVALHRAPIPVNFMLLMIKSFHMVGSLAYPEDWSATIEMLRSADLSPMITHRLPLERFEEALAIAKDPDAGAKVMIVNES